MPPADIPSTPEHSHHEQCEEPEPEESTAKNLEASAAGESSVEIYDGDDIEEVDANLCVEPTPKESADTAERIVVGKIVSARERTQEELDQRHREICEDFQDHRADFSGKVLGFDNEEQRPTQGTTDELVRKVDKITSKRPLDDPDRGQASYASEVPELVREETRNTDFEKDILRPEKLFAEVRCRKAVEPQAEKTTEETNETNDAPEDPDKTPETPAVKTMGITVVGKDRNAGWTVEYSHNSDSISPWQKYETENEEVIAIGTPTDAELRSLADTLEDIFDYDEKFAETQRQAIEQNTEEAPKTLGERAVLLGSAEEVSDPEDQAPNETISDALIERITAGELTVEGAIEEQIEKLCEECEFPFVEITTVAALYSLAGQLQPHLTEYDRMIIDDTSGRVPGLIYHQLINEAREAARLPRIKTVFVNGVSPQLDTAPPPEQGAGGRTLIFTEYSQTAFSLESLHTALKRHEPEVDVDIAAVSTDHYTGESFRRRFPYSEPRFFVGLTGGGAGDLYVKRPYKGVVKIRTDLHARRSQRRGEVVNRARQDAARIADVFSQLFIVQQSFPKDSEEKS